MCLLLTITVKTMNIFQENSYTVHEPNLIFDESLFERRTMRNLMSLTYRSSS